MTAAADMETYEASPEPEEGHDSGHESGENFAGVAGGSFGM